MPEAPPLARRDILAARLAGGVAVVAAIAAGEFGVSEDAIRRDLRALAQEGRCRRVYGGALPLVPGHEPLVARLAEAGDRKRRLARCGASSIEPGEMLFLDSGSTNLALVDFLPEEAELTIVTNAMEIAAAVIRRQDLRLIVIGGAADPVVGGCVDAEAVNSVASMRFDRTFLGACSVSAVDGIGVHRHAEAVFKRAVVANSRQLSVLAISERLDARASHRVAAMDRIGLVVLEAGAAPSQCAAFAAAGCRVAIAEGAE